MRLSSLSLKLSTLHILMLGFIAEYSGWETRLIITPSTVPNQVTFKCSFDLYKLNFSAVTIERLFGDNKEIVYQQDGSLVTIATKYQQNIQNYSLTFKDTPSSFSTLTLTSDLDWCHMGSYRCTILADNFRSSFDETSISRKGPILTLFVDGSIPRPHETYNLQGARNIKCIAKHARINATLGLQVAPLFPRAALLPNIAHYTNDVTSTKKCISDITRSSQVTFYSSGPYIVTCSLSKYQTKSWRIHIYHSYAQHLEINNENSTDHGKSEDDLYPKENSTYPKENSTSQNDTDIVLCRNITIYVYRDDGALEATPYLAIKLGLAFTTVILVIIGVALYYYCKYQCKYFAPEDEGPGVPNWRKQTLHNTIEAAKKPKDRFRREKDTYRSLPKREYAFPGYVAPYEYPDYASPRQSFIEKTDVPMELDHQGGSNGENKSEAGTVDSLDEITYWTPPETPSTPSKVVAK